jgi:hypothetical protein
MAIGINPLEALAIDAERAAMFARAMHYARLWREAACTVPRMFCDDLTQRELKKLYARAARIAHRDAKRALGRHDRIAIQLRGAS